MSAFGGKADIVRSSSKFHGATARAHTTHLKLCLPGPRRNTGSPRVIDSERNLQGFDQPDHDNNEQGDDDDGILTEDLESTAEKSNEE